MKKSKIFFISWLPVLVLSAGVSTGLSQTSGFPTVEEQALRGRTAPPGYRC
jgi:hypothetical protein